MDIAFPRSRASEIEFVLNGCLERQNIFHRTPYICYSSADHARTRRTSSSLNKSGNDYCLYVDGPRESWDGGMGLGRRHKHKTKQLTVLLECRIG